MTQNEVNIIKNSVLDATEAYVDARLSVADFVKTQIGVTQGTPTYSGGKYYHTVLCNATSGTSGITYNNVLSVGNIEFPNNSVVFLIAPNAQFTNQFILGKLDDTPCNIVGGSIKIGKIGSTNNYYFTVDSTGNLNINNRFKVDNTGNLFVGGTSTTNANFYVTNTGQVTMKSGSININNGQFYVDTSGNVTAKYLTANVGGYIGSFKITSNSLGDPMGATNAVGMVSGSHIYAYHPSHQIKMYSDELSLNNATISLDYGSSWIHISSQNIESNDKGYVLWQGSDKRYKKNIKNLSLDFSKELISKLQPKEFEFKTEKGKRYGFIAQDVRQTLDDMNCKNSRLEFTTDTGTNMHQLNYIDIIAPITLCIQDLYQQINELKKGK